MHEYIYIHIHIYIYIYVYIYNICTYMILRNDVYVYNGNYENVVEMNE